MKKMETSKKIIYILGVVVLALTVCCCFGIPVENVTMTAWGVFGVAIGFYFWKAKNENRSKYMQRYMEKWAKEYGPDTAIRAAEVVLKE